MYIYKCSYICLSYEMYTFNEYCLAEKIKFWACKDFMQTVRESIVIWVLTAAFVVSLTCY